MTVLAVDPGKKKCGLAVVSSLEGLKDKKVVSVSEVAGEASRLYNKFSPDVVIVGSGTGSKEVVRLLRAQKGLPTEVKIVGEKHTTEKAKYRYFQDNPPRGLWRLVPIGLQSPPTDYDDYAAVILAETYLAGHCQE